MLSRFVEEGSKIELRALQRGLEEKGAESTAKVLCKDHRPVQKQQRICAGHGTDQQSAEISEKRILSF